MRFLADMGVSQSTARWLRNKGYDVNQKLEIILSESSYALQKGAVISVGERTHRVRYLPII